MRGRHFAGNHSNPESRKVVLQGLDDLRTSICSDSGSACNQATEACHTARDNSNWPTAKHNENPLLSLALFEFECRWDKRAQRHRIQVDSGREVGAGEIENGLSELIESQTIQLSPG